MAAHRPYYSSQMYLPGSFYPVQYYSPGKAGYKATYSPTKSIHPTYSLKCYDNAKSVPPKHCIKPAKCKGYLIVLGIVLTVITIGILMGIILAVTANWSFHKEWPLSGGLRKDANFNRVRDHDSFSL